MGRVLRLDVHITPKGEPDSILLPKGAAVPAKYAKYVTNPKAYVESESAGDGEQAAESGPYAGESVSDLKAELKKRELPQTGNKSELIERLVADDAEVESESAGDGEQDADQENQE